MKCLRKFRGSEPAQRLGYRCALSQLLSFLIDNRTPMKSRPTMALTSSKRISDHGSRQKTCFAALRSKQGDGLFVEADKLLGAQPMAFVCNHPVGEIAAIFEHFQARFDSRTVQLDVVAAHEKANREGNLRGRSFIEAPHHPYEFAERRRRHDDEFGAL